MVSSIRFENATLVDVLERAVIQNSSVRVVDGLIVEVGRGRRLAPSSNEQIVDCTGRFLLPGLCDVHVHISAHPHQGPTPGAPIPERENHQAVEAARAGMRTKLAGLLYCGVTSIFDAGNDADLIFQLRDDERSGKIDSPRIYCTGGLVTCPGGHGCTIGTVTEINSLPVDENRIHDHLKRAPDLLKITYDEHNWGIRPLIPILDKATLRRVIEIAHESMTRVTVHVSNELRAREALACGADTLAHPVIQSPATETFLWQLAARKVPVASTLAIGERYFRLADEPDFLDRPLYKECLTENERYVLRTREHEVQKQNRWADWMRVMTPVAQENLRRLVSAGGIVASGSDLSFGPDLHRELELLQGASIPTWEVLRCATLNAAVFLGEDDRMGLILPGYVADILVTEQDPSEDVVNLSTIAMVMKGGRLVDRSSLPIRGGSDER